jgi:hypothetical protein
MRKWLNTVSPQNQTKASLSYVILQRKEKSFYQENLTQITEFFPKQSSHQSRLSQKELTSLACNQHASLNDDEWTVDGATTVEQAKKLLEAGFQYQTTKEYNHSENENNPPFSLIIKARAFCEHFNKASVRCFNRSVNHKNDL